MKIAAALLIVLALTGVFPREKKKEAPQPLPAPPVVVQAPSAEDFECGEPEKVTASESAKQRIVNFGEQLYRKPLVTDEVLEEVARQIVVFATAYCIEPELAAALIARESGFNPFAVSKAGAKGLGQLIDSTAREMGVSDPFDINQNLRGSLGYFKKLMDRWQGYPDQVDRALASYLQGPGAVEAAGGVPDASRRFVTEILEYRQRIYSM